MKNQFFLLIVSLYSVLFNSCDFHSTNFIDVKSIETIDLNPRLNNFTLLSDVFDKKYSVIQLESNNNSLFGKVSQLLFCCDRIFIMDRNHTHDLLIFDINGLFINRAKLLDNETLKYAGIGNMLIDKDVLEVLIDYPARLLRYDLDGNFINDVHLGGYAMRFAKSTNDSYCLFTDNNKTSTEAHHDLIIKNQFGEIKKKYLPIFEEKNVLKSLVLQNNFSIFGDTITFIRPFCDTIYHISSEEMTARYHVDFGIHTTPFDIYNGLSAMDVDDLLDRLKENNYAYAIQPFYESNEYLYFNYGYNSTWENLCLYSKRTKRLMNSSSVQNDINSMPFFKTVSFMQPSTNSIITVVPVYKIKAAFNEMKAKMDHEQFNEYISQHKDLYKIFTDSKESDNPILIIYKIKQSL